MARISFRLPDIQELSKQQMNARNLPIEGQHLIVGGPGTGKSVVALLRARRLAREKKDYLFLVYNVLLEKNSYGLGGEELKAVTWKKWFKNNFQTWFGKAMPVDVDNNEKWDAIIAMEPLENIDTSLYLIIDEGQDMPPQFYGTLLKVGFEHFYVVADQNQRITERNSTREDIEKALLIKPDDVLELTANYRNPLPVARLAQAFFTDDPASPQVDLPTPGVGDRIPRMMQYGFNTKRELTHIAIQILSSYDRNVDKLICIVTATDEIRNRFCDELRNVNLPKPLGHGRPGIQTYSSDERIVDDGLVGTASDFLCPQCGEKMEIRKNNKDNGVFWGCKGYPKCTYTKTYTKIDFRNGGIIVINQQSVKGLEFDTVYIADIDSYSGRDRDELMKKFYVMVSRARDDVVLLRTGESSPQVEAIIPNDETVLERR
jgi:predicted RNA-binding Zn-ribbon protein involved in translation (DUF1610 family)